MHLHSLESDIFRIVVNSDKGASIMAFFVKQHGSWLSLMPDTRTVHDALDSSCYLMIPYSNRIENGNFTFEGGQYQLHNANNHAIHGDVRARAWSIVSKNDSSIECFFSSAEYKDINWPWHFEARVRYHIGDTIFTSQVTLRNRSNASMPAGFGWHPYFNRSITRDYEPVYLRVKVAAAYPDAFGNRIPSGPPEQLTDDQDFTAEKILSRDVFLDTCFQGYDGNGTITWPDSRLRLTYDCSQECSHLIIFNPSYPYFAVEPVTNANNGVNLYSKGWPDSGIVSLAPGENLTARFSMKIELL